MDELAAMVGERCNVLLLEPAHGDVVKLSWLREGEGFAAYFELPREVDDLLRLLGELGLVRIHFHHVHGLPRAVLDLPRAANVPYDCTLHDYYAICPQYHLVTEQGRYCGEPDVQGCTACISKRPALWGLGITAWRAAFASLLAGADRVFAPSADVQRRIARYIPSVEVTILPHAETQPVSPRVVRVATLGALSPEKGLRVVAACSDDARARGLPLAFRVLGSTTEPLPQWPRAALSVHGQFAEAELPALIAAERPDVIWFPAQVPESYSYTLSAAIASGAAIVASALGAFPERLASHPRATLLSPGRFRARVERRAARRRRRGDRIPTRRASPRHIVTSVTDSQRYLAHYLAALPAGPRRTQQLARPPAVDDHYWYLSGGGPAAPHLTLPQLYVSGVECGFTEARQELRRRVAAFEADLGILPRAARPRRERSQPACAAAFGHAAREPRARDAGRQPGDVPARGARARRDARDQHDMAGDRAASPQRASCQDRMDAAARVVWRMRGRRPTTRTSRSRSCATRAPDR